MFDHLNEFFPYFACCKICSKSIEDKIQMSEVDWTKEFDINIPYADDFVREYKIKRKIEIANEKFNQHYKESYMLPSTKLTFSEEVEIYYFCND